MPDVRFNISVNVDGQNVIVRASAEARELARNLDAVASERPGMRDMLIRFNQIGESFKNLTTGLQQLTGVMSTYTAAHNTQVEAETRLMTVMRERMGASEKDLNVLSVALRGLMIATVVGAALAALGAMIYAITSSSRKAADGADD